MIIYHQAYDLYHTVFRMLQILTYFTRNESVELDRLRIWDFYLLFPSRMNRIKLKNNERDIRLLIKDYISKELNPYEGVWDSRKMFEKIRPYQIGALKCLASYGIINKDFLITNQIIITSRQILAEYSDKFEPLSGSETNALHLLTSHFYMMSLYGTDGLKERTGLLESKYDA